MRYFDKTSLICCSLLLLSGKLAFAQEWYSIDKKDVKPKHLGISGLALINDGKSHLKSANYPLNLLVVHDNKKDELARLAIIELKSSGKTKYVDLSWPKGKKAPDDLESLTSVPGQNNSYIAMTSKGEICYFKIGSDLRTVYLVETFELMPNVTDDEYESLSIKKMGSGLVAFWAKRGTVEKPGQLYWSKFNLKGPHFTGAKSIPIRAPWPKNTKAVDDEMRHIADLRVDASGKLYVIAALDKGNDGPFDSFCYVPGKFTSVKGQVYFVKAATAPVLYKFPKHKVEALEFLNIKGRSSVVFGTDDENLGAALQIRK